MTHTYRYDFNAKEHQPELGLNWHDYHARNYDAALGRWMNVDPASELYSGFSPYTYTLNNPLRYIDPTGMFVEPPDEPGEIEGDRYYDDDTGDTYEWDGEGGWHSDMQGGEKLDEVYITNETSSSTSSSSRGFYVQDGIPFWGSGTQDLGHKNGTRRGSIDMKKMPFSGPTGPKSSSKFAEWFRYMLTGLGLVENMPVVNKTAGITPAVSNSVLSVKELDVGDTIPITTKHWITNENGKPGDFVTLKHKNMEHANRSIKHYIQKGTTVNDIIIDSITKEIHK